MRKKIPYASLVEGSVELMLSFPEGEETHIHVDVEPTHPGSKVLSPEAIEFEIAFSELLRTTLDYQERCGQATTIKELEVVRSELYSYLCDNVDVWLCAPDRTILTEFAAKVDRYILRNFVFDDSRFYGGQIKSSTKTALKNLLRAEDKDSYIAQDVNTAAEIIVSAVGYTKPKSLVWTLEAERLIAWAWENGLEGWIEYDRFVRRQIRMHEHISTIVQTLGDIRLEGLLQWQEVPVMTRKLPIDFDNPPARKESRVTFGRNWF